VYNLDMRRLFACCFIIISLTACASKTETATDLAPAIPYVTGTPSNTPTIFPTRSGIIVPTPTPIIYIVVQGDTLNAIAGRYGISVDMLLAANPGLQPESLPVGIKLVIPANSTTPGESAPTPAPLLILQPHCWNEANGGLWCFALLQNIYADTLENISARFALLDSNGQEFANQSAYALLNTLPGGKSMPLAVHFPLPVQTNVYLSVQVLSAIPLLPGDLRYLNVYVENTSVRGDASGLTARLSGRVILPGARTAKSTWVLAIAYDAGGNVIGVRRWESSSDLTTDSPLSFDFTIYSVGPEIDKVEFQPEARP